MSDGPGDMNRELEKKAAAMVEKCCRKCDYRKCNMGSLCLPCSNNSNFTPSRAAIEAKLEELRNQTVIKQDSSSKSEESGEKERGDAKENLMDEAIEYFENLSSLPVLMNPAYPNRIERMAKKCQRYKDISDFLKTVKSEREEMIQAFKDIVNCVTLDNILEDSKRDIKEIAQKAIKKAEGK